jgi:hypothetical protein
MLIALMLIAVPAAAAVMTQNFQSATIEINGPCFTVTAGDDTLSATGFVAFASSNVTSGTVDLFQESLTVTGHAGNRAVYSEIAVFDNGCLADAFVDFIPATDPGGAAAFVPALTDPIWDEFNITFYLANTATPGDVLTSGDWDEVLSVDAGAVTTPDTASVPQGGIRYLAVVIDTDSAATAPPTAPTLRWTAQVSY